ncbi:hypothetical protein [Streptomyces sp. DASNCL29]|uniref:hypothetical protein n=1 Tax=Streptomyces sp. DASNCL29 TaxID=2583819 RepID=UPI00110FD44C|nr:hypothetical protein [Streptomyces sp. DASNCL29]TMU93186.1 hypothetical protein FGK60_27305 [Streptomyces sp. DASNCL29]
MIFSWWTRLSAAWQAMVIVPIVTGLAGGLVAIFFNVYGAEISDTIQSGPPLRVTVDVRDSALEGGYFRLPGRIPAKNGKVDQWDLQNDTKLLKDAIDIGHSLIQLTIEGRRSHTIAITDIRAKIVKRTAPQDGGTLFITPSQGSEDAPLMGVSLDDPSLRAREQGGNNYLLRPYFDGHSITVTDGEVVTLLVKPSSYRDDVVYYLTLEIVVDGKKTTMAVGNGHPFRTMGYATRYDDVYKPDDETPGLLEETDLGEACKEIAQCKPIRISHGATRRK